MAEKTGPTEAKTEKYDPRPLKDALAKPADIVKAEDRPDEDQIEGYHKDNPTLGAKGAPAPPPDKP